MTVICKDCAHATHAYDWVCRKQIDVVTGDAVSCRVARSEMGECTPDGRLFEKRFDPTDAVTYTVQRTAIETPKATIRQEGDRPWEGKGKDYSPE